MALPSSRDISLNPGDPVPSTLLNKLQDLFIGVKRNTGWRWITPVKPNVDSGNTMNADGLSFAAAGTFSGMPLGWWEEGSRITGFAVKHLGTAPANTVTYTLNLNKGDGAPTVLGTLTIVNPAVAWVQYTLTFDGLSGRPSPFTMPAGSSLYLSETTAQQVANKLGLVGVQTDKL